MFRLLRRRAPLWLALAAVATALAWNLDGYPLLEPDEGRNAEVMREMAEGNAYVLPRLNGLPYLDKPVLYFAAGAAAMEVLGPTERAARLPSALFTVLTLLIAGWFGGRLFGRAGAWTAAFVTAAMPFTVAYARTVIFDSALACFVTAALACFFTAVDDLEADGPRRWSWWAAAGWGATALGVLTKGPVALVFVLIVALPYALWRRRWRAVGDPVGLLGFVALLLPWVLAVSRDVPEFLRYVLVVETAQRLATPALGRTGPLWYFFPILLGAALPWIVLAGAGWRRRVLRLPDGTLDRRTVFLLLWILAPLLFFTLSQSKRPQYLLPVMPAVALLVARVWHVGAGVLPGVRAAAGTLVVFGGALVTERGRLAELFDTTPAVAAAIPPTALWLGLAAVLGGSLAFAVAERRDAVLLALGTPVLAIPLLGMPLMRAIGADRSSAALAEAIAPVLTAETEVVGVGVYPLSLPFYLQRQLVLATATGAELTSNYVTRHVDGLRALPDSPLRPADWWREAAALCGTPRLFAVARDDAARRAALAELLPVRAESRKVVVYGPCGGAGLARTP